MLFGGHTLIAIGRRGFAAFFHIGCTRRLIPMSINFIHHHIRRCSMIDGCKLLTVAMHRCLMRYLLTGWPHMPFLHPGFFLSSCTRSCSPAATIEANSASSLLVNHGLAYIYISNDCCIDVGNISVIMKTSISPHSTHISFPEISASIVDTTVKSNMQSPVSGMPSINTSNVTPIRRCPQITHFRRNNPHSGYPIVSVCRVICPISGYPDISFFRTRRLHINWQWRRRNRGRDRHSNTNLRLRMSLSDQQRQ